MKKKLLAMHVNMDDFIPATGAEKEYMVQMRPASTFFKDGMKRLLKNKVATASLVIIVLITLTAIFLPMAWPYSYHQMLGVVPRKPVDPSYNNLAPFTYGATEGCVMLGKANAQEYFLAAGNEASSFREGFLLFYNRKSVCVKADPSSLHLPPVLI